MTADFSAYLEGFASGLALAKAAKAKAIPASTEPQGPDAPHIAAQNRVLEGGGKLSDPEKWKREENPFDAYGRLKEQAQRNEFPKPADNFRWRYYGLFYVAPNQVAYMYWQLGGLADVAERHGGGYSHVTTRANLQIREIGAKDAVTVLEAIQDLGLCSRGSGADNIRNVTGTATAGIDPQELIDTRPFAREWHFHILNSRALYGLPRKFNVGFDGAGRVPTLEDTNDIGFQAVRVRDGFGVEPYDRSSHIGVHPQKQPGLYWLGITLPVGKISAPQMRKLARIAQELGDGDIRLTVWQNLMISGVPEAKIGAVEAAVKDIGLSTSASSIRAGLIACTGNMGCRFAASDTKAHAEAIAAYLEPRIEVDSPVNIHVTGCSNPCAQHYIGDIGLIGARVAISDEGDTVEGYHLYAGGGFGHDAKIGREIVRDVKAEDAPQIIERLLRFYLRKRSISSETFVAFASRCETADLQAAARNEGAHD